MRERYQTDIYEYGAFVYQDKYGYYHMTIVYTSGNPESIYVEKNMSQRGQKL